MEIRVVGKLIRGVINWSDLVELRDRWAGGWGVGGSGVWYEE